MIVAPRYLTGSLADVLPGAFAALGLPGQHDRLGLATRLEGVRRVAVLLVDGMGWHQLPQLAEYSPVIADTLAGKLGSTQRLTCGFPSTTPVGLVSFGTGAPPGAHGVMGFTTVVPGTGTVLNHTRWLDDPTPSSWQPLPTLFTVAGKVGISSAAVNRSLYQGSGLTTSYCGGAEYRPADDAETLAERMLAALREKNGPALVYGYHPELDKAGHESGLESAAWADAAVEVNRLLDRLIDGMPADAALLVTADHGQFDVPADRRLDIATEPRLVAGLRLLAGEPRVRYLHAQPGAQQDLLEAWRALAGHLAWIGSREEAVDTGWYGPVTAEHAQRLGDVVVVCEDDWAVFSSTHDHPGLMNLVAMHGSLTAAEMEIPLLVYRAA